MTFLTTSLGGCSVVFCVTKTQLQNMKDFKLLIKIFFLAITTSATMMSGIGLQLKMVFILRVVLCNWRIILVQFFLGFIAYSTQYILIKWQQWSTRVSSLIIPKRKWNLMQLNWSTNYFLTMFKHSKNMQKRLQKHNPWKFC